MMKTLLLFSMMLLVIFTRYADALPEGGKVVAGQAQINQADAHNMHVNQATNKAIINWKGFSIAQPEAVRFFQPGSGSVALNRVTGGDPSEIYGLLQANGGIFLINPNGILIGPSGEINVNAFVASTLDISNEDFLAENYRLTQNPQKSLASIVNQGVIQAAEDGHVSLMAPAVRNEGLIFAELGKVYIGAGERVTLNFEGNDLIGFAVDESIKDKVLGPDGKPLGNSISNTGEISADGGRVILSAKTAYEAIKSVVNNEGVIEAKTLVSQNGVIKLMGGDRGIVANRGVLDASGKEAGQTGGTVQVLGEKVGLFDHAVVDVSGDAGGGTALVGGDFQGKNPDVPNAQRTYVGPDASIAADAITDGDGGEVIVWSDKTSQAYGTISARGGSISGDGGFVETSSKGHLDVTRAPDIGAGTGSGGSWLIDPSNINIIGANANITASSPFQSNAGAPSTLDVATLVDAINNAAQNTTIEVDAIGGTDTPGNTGTITLSNTLSATTTNTGVTLLFTADDTITINADLTGAGSGLSVTLSVTNDLVDVNNPITTNGGNFTVTNASEFDLADVDISVGVGDINIEADTITIAANTGNNALAGTGSLTLQPNTVSRTIGLGGGGGDFNLDDTEIGDIADGFSSITIGRAEGTGEINAQAVTFTDPVTVRSGGGANISVDAGAFSSGANAMTFDAGTGLFTLAAAGTLTSGDLTIAADTVALGAAADANEIAASGAVRIQPTTQDQTMSIAGGSAGTFEIDDDEIEVISDTATSVTFGRTDGTGAVAVGAKSFDFSALTIIGGNVDVEGALTTSTDTDLTLDGDGIDQSAGGTINMGAGFVRLNAGGAAVTSALDNVTITTTNTDDGGLTIDNATTIGATSSGDAAALETAVAELTITNSNGNAFISEADAVELQGIALGAANTLAINLEVAGDLTQAATGITGGLNATLNNGVISLTNDANDIDTISGITLNATTGLSSITSQAGGTGNDLTVSGNINTATGALTLDLGTGQFARNDGATITNTGGLTVTADTLNLGTAADEIDISGAVVLQPDTLTRTVGISGGGGAFSISAAEVEVINGANATAVRFGRTDGTGDVNVGADSFDYAALTIAGGNVDVEGALTTSTDTDLTLDGNGIDQSAGGTINMGAGFVRLNAGGAAVTSALDNVTITTTNTDDGGLTIDNATTIGATSSGDAAALETAVAELTITNSNGNAFISEADAVELQEISVGANTFSLSVQGNITQTDVMTADTLVLTNTAGTTELMQNNVIDKLGAIDVTGGAFQLTNTVDLTFTDAINATGQDVSIIDNGGSISDGTAGVGGILLTAENLSLSATGAIDVNLNIALVAAESTTAGNIRIDDTSTTNVAAFGGVTGIQTTGSDVTLVSGDTITLTSPIAAGSGGTVTLISGGQINDGNASNNTADITTAGVVSLTASTGIGVINGSLDLDVGTVTLATTGTGGVNLNLLDPNNSNIAVTAVTATTAGNIAVESTEGGDGSGTFTFATVTAQDGTIDLSASEGNITAQALRTADTAGRSIGIVVTQADRLFTHDSGAIQTDGGAITISADQIALSGGTIATGAADVQLRPTDTATVIDIGNGATDSAATLGLTAAELNIITTDAANAIIVGDAAVTGDISVVGALDLNAGGSSNLSLRTGSTSTAAGAEAINDGTAGATGNLTTGTNLVLSAAGAIDVNAAVDLVAAQSTTSGDIRIDNAGSTNVSGFGGLMGIQTTASDITLVSANTLTIAEEVNARSNGNVTLTSTGGNIKVNADVLSTALSTGNAGDGSGTLTLNAALGAITTNGAGTLRATAGSFSFVAGAAVGTAGSRIITTVTELLSGSATGAGGIYLNETDALTLTSLSNANGLIDVTAGAAVTAVSVATTGGTDSDDIILTTTAGDIELGTINATGDGDVSLTAAAAITDADTNSSVTADDLSFAAAGAVGAAGSRINTTVTEVLSGSSTGAGGIYLNETDALTLTSLSNNNGLIDVTAGAAVTAVSVATTGGTDSDDIILATTAGDIELGTINAAGDADVSLTAAAAITDADTNSSVTADDLIFTAAGAVGTAAARINTTVAEVLSGSSTSAGGIYLNETNALTLTSLGNASGLIDVTAAGKVTAVSVSTTGGTNDDDIILTTTAGDIEVGTINAAGDGDVSLTAGAAITDADANSSVTADDLSFTAAGPVGTAGSRINTTVAEVLSGSSTGAGGIYLNETDALALTSLSNANGLIDVTAAGKVTAVSVSTTGGTNNDDIILTTTAGDIELGTINAAGDGDVSLTAAAAITDSDTNSSVTADDLNFTAAGAVGTAAARINTTVAEVPAGNSTGAGGIYLNETDALTLTSLGNASGLIDVTAAGKVTAVSVSTAGGTNNDDIILTTTAGDIEVGTINAAGDGDVSLTAAAAITDADANSSVRADDLTFSAAGAVGTNGSRINTTVTEVLAGNSTGAGGIFLNETDALALTSLNNANGSIEVKAGGTLIIDNSGAGNAITTVDGGRVTLDADGATSNVLVNDGIQSVNGAITVTADNDIVFEADGDVRSTAGNVRFTADADNGGVASGALTMVDGTVIDAGSGTIGLAADGDITLGRLVTTSTNNAAVTLTSTEGGIVDGGNTGGRDVKAATGRLVIDAVTGVGHNGAIETQVASLDIDNATNGNIDIAETDALTVFKAAQASAGNIQIVTGGTLTVDNAGTGEAVTTVESGTVTLVANGAASDVVVNDGIQSVNGSIRLSADDAVTVSNALESVMGDINISGTAITTNAKISTSGNVAISGTDNITIAGAVDSKTASLDSQDDVAISSLVSAVDQITVTAGSDGTGDLIIRPTADIKTTGSGSNIELTAGNSILLDGKVATKQNLILTARNGVIDGRDQSGTFSAEKADIKAQTLGIEHAPAADVSDFTVTLSQKTSINLSGQMFETGRLDAFPPPSAVSLPEPAVFILLNSGHTYGLGTLGQEVIPQATGQQIRLEQEMQRASRAEFFREESVIIEIAYADLSEELEEELEELEEEEEKLEEEPVLIEEDEVPISGED